MIETPYFHLVPRDIQANLEWRLKLRRAALHDLEAREAIRQACFEDPLFFICFACFLIEPRVENKVIPFCVWDMQIPAIEALVESMTLGAGDTESPIDVIFDKSRTRGATWICLCILLWYWLKDPMFAGGIISRSMEAVDKTNDLGALMPKIDWLISMLPFWLRPKGFSPKDRSKTDHVWYNCEKGGVLAGTACTGEAFSGNRLSVLFYDEAAKVKHVDFQDAMDSTQHVTNVRWIVSSHFGDSGPFYDMVFGEEWHPDGKIFPLGGSGIYRNPTGGIKVVLDWKDHPPHGRLPYRIVNGIPLAVYPADDKELRQYFKENYGNLARLKRRGFVKEGRIRAPWLDKKCLQKGATPHGIAQDVDRDPRATVGKIFRPEIMDDAMKSCREPTWQGDVVIHGGLRFVQMDDGPLKFWVPFTLREGLPKGRYCYGADPGTGIENSESGVSTIIGADASTGEQIMEWNQQLSEQRLADLAVALCEWSGDAMLIWEAQGSVGKRFATRVMDELNYWNVWVRRGYKRHGQTAKPDMFGWSNNRPRDKMDLFTDLYSGMDDKEFIPRSEALIAECRGWEKDEKGVIVYHGTGHGDRAIAAGMCYKAMKEFGLNAIDKKTTSGNSDENEWSIAGRMTRKKSLEMSRKNDIFSGFRCGTRGMIR